MSEYNASYTENLSLEKPHKKQKYDIAVFNSNFDIIDENAKQQKDDLERHKKANPLDHPDGSVQNRHLASNSVSSYKIQSGAVTTDKIYNGAVTTDKLATIVSGGTYNGITFNSKGLITSAREVVVDAYTKRETYTKTEVDNLLKNISSIEVRYYD